MSAADVDIVDLDVVQRNNENSARADNHDANGVSDMDVVEHHAEESDWDGNVDFEKPPQSQTDLKSNKEGDDDDNENDNGVGGVYKGIFD